MDKNFLLVFFNTYVSMDALKGMKTAKRLAYFPLGDFARATQSENKNPAT